MSGTSARAEVTGAAESRADRVARSSTGAPKTAAVAPWKSVSRRALIDFLFTLLMLGAAFVLALGSAALAPTDGVLAAVCSIGALLLALGGGLYIVPKLARRVQGEFAHSFATKTSVTSDGLIFLSLVVLVGVAAWNTANNLLYLVLAALLAFVVASGSVARQMLRDVAVKLRFPDHIFAGESVRLSVSLVNQKRLIPSCSVSVEAFAESFPQRATGRAGGASLSLAHFIAVAPRSTATQIVEHTFARRGLYRIDGFSLVTRFPSGFFRKIRRVAADGELVVFPPVRPADDFFHSLPMPAGASESMQRGEGIDLYGMRDYRASDDMRRIDWKASARSDRLTVRETLRDEERILSIYFDTTAHGEITDDFAARFETAVELAASLARHFLNEGSQVELVTPERRVPAASGRDHLYPLLAELAVVAPSPAPEDGPVAWDLLSLLPGVGDDHRFKVLFTAAHQGGVPANVWRAAHVIFIGELDAARPATGPSAA